MPEIRIAALDLDGTLLSRKNTVTPATRQAIADAAARGVVVLPATGRALANLPPLVTQLPGVRYAITSNGAAVYHLPDRLCIHESAMEPALVCPIIEELQKKSIHMDAFINGDGFSQRSCEGKIDCLDMPTSIKRYIHRTRTFTDDLAAYIRVLSLIHI